jgi:hypothetical protein
MAKNGKSLIPYQGICSSKEPVPLRNESIPLEE